MLHFFNKLIDKIARHADKTAIPYILFGLFGIVTYPFFYLVWYFANPSGYENLSLRLIAILLCIPLTLKNYWPLKLQRFLPAYWYSVITYALPFLFTFLLLKNNFSETWVLNVFTVILLLILILDYLSLPIVLIIGVTFGVIAYHFTTPAHALNALDTDWTGIVIAYLTALIFGAIFSFRKENIQKTKINSMNVLSASVAHELRTPLRAISAGVGGINKYLPTLISTYKKATENNLDVPFINPAHFKSLLNICDSIEAESRAAFNVIDMLLVKINNLGEVRASFVDISINYCIEETLNRYPFEGDDLKLIHFDKNSPDFTFRGDELLTIHILFNLLKNAIYYVRAANKGDIHIWAELGEDYNLIHFKDTGIGIPKKNLPHIFSQFFTTSMHGTGVGLAFCKLVMQEMGGDIRCFSKQGEFTEFVLSFPVVRKGN